MSVRVRMAPSPTGLLHIGNVRTALFNWLFARQHDDGEFHLRIEDTDTSREVAEATQQIQDSLSWLGLDLDGEVTFQLDRIEQCAEVARKLVAEDKAYEDEGAIRFRMPDEGTTGWDDVVRGRIEVPNETIEDLVIVRTDGRPTYNFASPMEDVWDGVTHVIRGEDHISNTPKQINIIRAVGAEVPVYAHVPNVNGTDNKKLSKRHGAVTVKEFRNDGYVAPALMNFLALLGWAPDGETTIMSRDELVRRFDLGRVQPSPAAFDYAKLDWMNGVYLRAMSAEEYADALIGYLREQGSTWAGGRIGSRRRRGRGPCGSGVRLGRGADSQGGATRPGEDRAPRRVSELRRLPVRAARAAGVHRRGSSPGRGRDAGRGRAVRRLEHRGGAPRARGAARAQAARGLSADSLGGDGVEGLAGVVREPRVARQGGVVGADRRQRPRRSQRIERTLKLAPGAAPELDGGPGKQLVHPNKAAAFVYDFRTINEHGP